MNKSLIQVLLGGVLISFSAVFVRLMSVGPDVAGFYRTFVGGLFLLLLALRQKKTGSWSKAFLIAVLVAGTCHCLNLVSWHRSIARVGPGLATILINFQVFLLAAYGALFKKESLSKMVLVAMPLALCGLWLLLDVDLSGTNGGVLLAGVLFGLSAAFWFGNYTWFVRVGRSAANGISAIPQMACVSLVASVWLGGVALYTGQSLAIPSVTEGGLLIGYGIVAQGIGWLLIAEGLPGVPAVVAAMAILVMPTLSVIWDLLFFDLVATPNTIIGAIMALVAIRMGVNPGKKKIEPLPSE